MARIPTPVPRSLVERLIKAFRGRWTDTIWKAFVLVLFLGVGVGLAAAGPIGYVVAGIILGSLLTDVVQNAIADVWNRNFWVFTP